MLKKGISAKDLRPFSMDDPYGLGVVSPTQERLRKRFHRKVARRAATAAASQVARGVIQQAGQAPAPQTKKRQAPPPPRVRTASPQKEKKKSGGCLTTLIVIGVLYGLGSVFVPLIVNGVEQQIVLHTGTVAHGRVVSASATDTEFMEETVYAMVVEVHVPGYDPYQVELEQALPESKGTRLVAGTWVQLRYDPDDLTSIAIESVGGTEPTEEEPDSAIEEDADAAEPNDRAQGANGIPGDQVVPTPSSGRVPVPTDDAQKPSPAEAEDEPDEGAPEPEETTEGPAEDAVPTPEAAPEPEAPEPVPLVCHQARACCQIAGGGACASFSQPGVPAKKCRKALRGFSKLAKGAGKSCSGLN